MPLGCCHDPVLRRGLCKLWLQHCREFIRPVGGQVFVPEGYGLCPAVFSCSIETEATDQFILDMETCSAQERVAALKTKSRLRLKV